jgi:hypothetical protein
MFLHRQKRTSSHFIVFCASYGRNEWERLDCISSLSRFIIALAFALDLLSDYRSEDDRRNNADGYGSAPVHACGAEEGSIDETDWWEMRIWAENWSESTYCASLLLCEIHVTSTCLCDCFSPLLPLMAKWLAQLNQSSDHSPTGWRSKLVLHRYEPNQIYTLAYVLMSSLIPCSARETKLGLVIARYMLSM